MGGNPHSITFSGIFPDAFTHSYIYHNADMSRHALNVTYAFLSFSFYISFKKQFKIIRFTSDTLCFSEKISKYLY